MRFWIAFAALSLFSSTAFADDAKTGEVDAAALEQCLIKNSGQEQEDAFRRFLIAVFQNNNPVAKVELKQLGLTILTLASSKCGVTLEQLKQPEFVRAVSAYGGYVGKKIVGDALAKMPI